MKVQNMVRGAVVALSLGLASLGTGMGLTSARSLTDTAGQSAMNAAGSSAVAEQGSFLSPGLTRT